MIYTKDYYRGKNSTFSDNYMETAEDRAKYRCDNLIRWFNPSSFIEVGCAYGENVKYMSSIGIESYGFDICNDCKDYDNNIFVGPADDFPIKKRVDLVYSSDVVEHLTMEQAIKCFEQSKEYGRTVVHVISCSKFNNLGDVSYVEGMDDGHISMYTIEKWQKIFKKIFQTYNVITLQSPETIVFDEECYHSAALIAIEQDRLLNPFFKGAQDE